MTPEQTAKMTQWTTALNEAAAVKPIIEREQALRKEVMAMFFPDPKEGTNKAALDAGWMLSGVHKIERKIDAAALPAAFAKLREMGVNPDPLVDYKPEISTTMYKLLRDTNPEAAHVFETALIIKPGSPTLSLVPPKPAKE